MDMISDQTDRHTGPRQQGRQDVMCLDAAGSCRLYRSASADSQQRGA